MAAIWFKSTLSLKPVFMTFLFNYYYFINLLYSYYILSFFFYYTRGYTTECLFYAQMVNKEPWTLSLDTDLSTTASNRIYCENLVITCSHTYLMFFCFSYFLKEMPKLIEKETCWLKQKSGRRWGNWKMKSLPVSRRARASARDTHPQRFFVSASHSLFFPCVCSLFYYRLWPPLITSV